MGNGTYYAKFRPFGFSLNIGGAYQLRLSNQETLHNNKLCMSPELYDVLLQQTLSSFLKFVAHQYKAAPVRTTITPTEPCPACKRPMVEQHRTTVGALRILWHCERCNQSLWRNYRNESVRERRQRWHYTIAEQDFLHVLTGS
jgi:ribosomal protein L37AE/L43A